VLCTHHFHTRKTALVGAEHPPYILGNRLYGPAAHIRNLKTL